jgi:glycosyltransferase involved in cell wall biosynthesis
MEKQKYSSIVVVDYTWGGHVPTYHKHICKALLEAGYRVYSISNGSHEVLSWLEKQMPVNKEQIGFWSWNENAATQVTGTSKASIIATTEKKKSLKQITFNFLLQWPILEKIFVTHERWKAAQKRIEEIMPDCRKRNDVLVLFPCLDLGFLAPYYPAWLFNRAFKMPWSGIYFHPTFYRTGRSAKPMLGIFKSATCRAIALLDESFIKQFSRAINKRVIQFPDITMTDINREGLSGLATRIKQLAGDRKIISLLGVLSDKKNIFTLIETIKLSLKQKRPFYFLIAGETNKYYWNSVEDFNFINTVATQLADNTSTYFGPIADGNDYNSLIYITDVLLASYHNFYHSSNTLTKAANFKKPVIVSKGYLMEERVKKYDLGIAIEDRNAEQLLNAIIQLVDGKDLKNDRLSPKYKEYYDHHSYDRLKLALSELIN